MFKKKNIIVNLEVTAKDDFRVREAISPYIANSELRVDARSEKRKLSFDVHPKNYSNALHIIKTIQSFGAEVEIME